MRKIKRLEDYSDSIVMPKKKGRKSGSKSKRIRNLKLKKAVKDYKRNKNLINAVWLYNKEYLVENYKNQYPDYKNVTEDKVKESFLSIINELTSNEVSRLTEKYTRELIANGYDPKDKKDKKKMKEIIDKKVKKNINMRTILRKADKVATPSSMEYVCKNNLRKSLTAEEMALIRKHDPFIATSKIKYDELRNGYHVYKYKCDDGTVIEIKRQQYDYKAYYSFRRKN